MSKVKDAFFTGQEPPEPLTPDPDPDPDYELYCELTDILKGKSDKVIADEHEEAARIIHQRMVG